MNAVSRYAQQAMHEVNDLGPSPMHPWLLWLASTLKSIAGPKLLLRRQSCCNTGSQISAVFLLSGIEKREQEGPKPSKP